MRFGGMRLYAPEEGGEGGAGGGAPAADANTETQVTDGGAAAAGGAPAGDKAEPKQGDMLNAIDQALGYKKTDDQAGDKGGQPATGDKGAAAKGQPDPNEEMRTFLVSKGAKAEDLAKLPEADLKKQFETAKAADAAKPKDLDALGLTEAEKKTWKRDTQERFAHVMGIAKSERTAREAAEAKVKPLEESRNAILGILRETNTTDQDLSTLLEFNRMQKSGDPKLLEQALEYVSGIRVSLMKKLGREGDGHDPLAEYPDLQQEVTDLKISRERALEIVQTRKREAIEKETRERNERLRSTQQQTTQQQQKAVNDGVNAIEAWCIDQAKKDIDFKAKEAILLPQIEAIVREYPPNLWLKTIQQVYAAIVVQKQAAALPNAGAHQPLRPSGAKPGNPAPTSMAEAIDQGLGYVKG